MRFFMVALMCMMVSSVCLADDRIVPVNQLPANAKLFIQEHFPEANISYAVLDREFKGKRYDVRLNNNMEIEFDKKGNWIKVNCKGYPVPAALIPPMISEYVTAWTSSSTNRSSASAWTTDTPSALPCCFAKEMASLSNKCQKID